MTVHILTHEWSRTVEGVSAALLPGTLGPFEVLRGHAPIISTLEKGCLRLRTEAGEETLEIKGGAVAVKDDTIKLCIEI